MNLGSGGSSKPKLRHRTLFWVTERDSVSKKKKERKEGKGEEKKGKKGRKRRRKERKMEGNTKMINYLQMILFFLLFFYRYMCHFHNS